MSTFSDNLRAARLAKHKTIVQCADALGITNPAWNQWETGKREPKYDKLIEICLLLDCSPNELLGIDNNSQPSVINTGNNSPVAIGNHANATVSLGDAPACSKCPYKKRLAKIEKMLGK